MPGISEVLHAEFHEHAYPPHTHDTWTVFVVDDGQIRYDLDRRHRGAGRSTVGVLPPHVVHDGRTATSRGYRKRVIYVETSLLSESLIGRAVDQPSIEDVRLRRRLDVLHERLRHPDEALEAESHLAFVAERLKVHLEDHADEEDPGRVSKLAEQLREHLQAHEFEVVTLAAAGENSSEPALRISFAASARRSESRRTRTSWVGGSRRRDSAYSRASLSPGSQRASASATNPISPVTSNATSGRRRVATHPA